MSMYNPNQVDQMAESIDQQVQSAKRRPVLSVVGHAPHRFDDHPFEIVQTRIRVQRHQAVRHLRIDRHDKLVSLIVTGEDHRAVGEHESQRRVAARLFSMAANVQQNAGV